jgi:hypothetical protein
MTIACAPLAHGVHDVDRNEAVRSERARRANLAIQGFEVGIGMRARVVTLAQPLHDIGVQAAQVDARDGADCAFLRDTAGKAMCGDADTHTALDDGQELVVAQGEWREGGTDRLVCLHRQRTLADRRAPRNDPDQAGR